MMRLEHLARTICFAGLASLTAASATPTYTIAFKSFAPNNTDLFIADADGKNVRALVPNSALDYDASFSRDGRWIFFTSHRSGSPKIYRVHPDGSGLERLTDGSSFDDQAAPSPDGKSIAFVSTRGGQADIWVFELANHKLRNLTNHPAGDFRPRVVTGRKVDCLFFGP
jgi:TolB protein